MTKIWKKPYLRLNRRKISTFLDKKHKNSSTKEPPSRGLTNLCFRPSAVHATNRKNQTFSTPKFCYKGRRQNTLNKLVTKFSTLPLWRPPQPEFSPLTATNKNHSKLSRPSVKIHQNKKFILEEYSTIFHSTIVKSKSIPQLWIFLVQMEVLFDFDYWIHMYIHMYNTDVHTCIACWYVYIVYKCIHN